MSYTPVNAKRHGRRCGCQGCLGRMVADYEQRLSYFGDITPPTRGHTVPVKPHWRKVSKHLNYNPALQEIVADIVRSLAAKRK